jgi:hypothetical protein
MEIELHDAASGLAKDTRLQQCVSQASIAHDQRLGAAVLEGDSQNAQARDNDIGTTRR